jgi:hypothetical protein
MAPIAKTPIAFFIFLLCLPTRGAVNRVDGIRFSGPGQLRASRCVSDPSEPDLPLMTGKGVPRKCAQVPVFVEVKQYVSIVVPSQLAVLFVVQNVREIVFEKASHFFVTIYNSPIFGSFAILISQSWVGACLEQYCCCLHIAILSRPH